MTGRKYKPRAELTIEQRIAAPDFHRNEARSARLWPPERVAQLSELVADGLTFDEIGRRMGISKNATIGKARRLGLERRPNAPQTAMRVIRSQNEKYYPPTIERLRALNIFPDAGCYLFPLGNPGAPLFSFCGATAASEGAPYCAAHHLLTHVRAAPQKSAEGAA